MTFYRLAKITQLLLILSKTVLLCYDVLCIEHRALIQTVRNNQQVIEENFGKVAFEMVPLLTNGGTQNATVAHLTKEQAEFIATLSKNTPTVIAFKAALVVV